MSQLASLARTVDCYSTNLSGLGDVSPNSPPTYVTYARRKSPHAYRRAGRHGARALPLGALVRPRWANASSGGFNPDAMAASQYAGNVAASMRRDGNAVPNLNSVSQRYGFSLPPPANYLTRNPPYGGVLGADVRIRNAYGPPPPPPSGPFSAIAAGMGLATKGAATSTGSAFDAARFGLTGFWDDVKEGGESMLGAVQAKGDELKQALTIITVLSGIAAAASVFGVFRRR